MQSSTCTVPHGCLLMIVCFGCRFWPAPRPNYLLVKANVQNLQQRCRFDVRLLVPALSFVWHHQVQGRPLLSGSASLEMAIAAAGTLETPDPSAAGFPSQRGLLLNECTIPNPATLSSSAKAMQLEVVLKFENGTCSVLSGTRAIHLDAHLHRWLNNSSPCITHRNRDTQVILPENDQCAPMATALLDVNPVIHTDGYNSHPAVVDGCLHLAASLAGRVQESSSTLGVPVGAQSYLSKGEASPSIHGKFYSNCNLAQVLNDGSVSNHHMMTACAAVPLPPLVTIKHLKARQTSRRSAHLWAAPSHFALAVKPGSNQLVHGSIAPALMYQVLWQADTAAARWDWERKLITRHASVAVIASQNGRTVPQLATVATSTAANPAPPLLRLLSHLREIIASSGALEVQKLRLETRGGLQEGALPLSRVNYPAAAAWGMTRAAASEVAGMDWAMIDLDTCAVGSELAASEPSDASGTIVRHGIVVRPLLGQLAPLRRSSDTLCMTGHMCRILVTGGLGGEAAFHAEHSKHKASCKRCNGSVLAGIGTLLGTWLSLEVQTCLTLLGRVGYFNDSIAELMLSEAPVTTLRCNAAHTNEVAAACAHGGTQLAAVLHAGGVLQDGLLHKQTSASMRAVLASKLAFVAHTAATLLHEGVQTVHLFSSIAAFLGTPGQSNYAAANSALNAWASVMQQHGMQGKHDAMFCSETQFLVRGPPYPPPTVVCKSTRTPYTPPHPTKDHTALQCNCK